MEYVDKAIALLDEQIEDLEEKLIRVRAAREALEAISDGTDRPDPIRKAVYQKRVMSEDARARIAEAQRRRWGRVNAAAASETVSDTINTDSDATITQDTGDQSFATSADFKVTPIPVETIRSYAPPTPTNDSSTDPVEPAKPFGKVRKTGHSNN